VPPTAAEGSRRAGRLTYLSEQDKQDIYGAALEIIAGVGMRVHHPQARQLLRAAGCEVASDDVVRIPAALVERARQTAPHVVEVFDREGRPAMSLGGYSSYFGSGSDLMSTYDLESGEHRPSTLADVARAARLCDALPNIDFIMSCAYPNEVDPHRSYLESFRGMVVNSAKPMVMTSENAADLEVMWKIACALRGGAEQLRAKPYFTMYLEPVSPLSHPVESVDKLLFCADWGIPAIYSPAPLAGATAPITVAGHTAQGAAESLFGLVMHQLRRPGSPFIFGIGPAVLDMATSQSSYNAPEYLMTFLCQIELARWLDLPNWGYGGTSDSQLVDAQAGMEIAELAFICMAAGSNLNHDVGYLDFGLTAALEQLVIVDEYVAMNRRLFAGVDVTPETLAVDTIRQVGPGGDFLGSKHTARHVRTAQWRPTVLNRLGRQRWLEDGAHDLRERARLKALGLLETHAVPALDERVAQRIDQLIDSFEVAGQAAGGQGLSVG
jgi:trimethylamine--corrinoid protein Co-methyltransferase